MHIVIRNWWALALRGIAAVLFGLIAIIVPQLTLAWLIYLFAAYMLIDGVFAIVAGVRALQHHERSAGLWLEGVLDLVAGAIALFWPVPTLVVFVYVAAFWAIVTGFALLSAAFRVGRDHGEWLLLLAGFLSLAWGIAVALWPIAGLLAWVWWIGAYALVFGVIMLGTALRLRTRHLLRGDARR
jgi:uncharacterized membrane protein HdeD (DUF308 family)